MVGGLGMARAAHVVGEKVRERRRVVRRVSMVDWGACLWLSFVRFVEWFRRRFTIARESGVHESYVEVCVTRERDNYNKEHNSLPSGSTMILNPSLNTAQAQFPLHPSQASQHHKSRELT